jgi:hypothetical protein
MPHMVNKHLTDKNNWTISVCNSIAWDSLKIAFNKLTTAQKIVTTKTMSSFWCTNLRHKRDRGKLKKCNLVGDENEDLRQVLTCQGTGALIFRTGSWAQPRTQMNKWKIHPDIWHYFDHGLQNFTRHPIITDRSRPTPPFGPSLRAQQCLRH